MEDPSFSLVVTAVGEDRIAAVRIVRAAAGLAIWDAKLLLDELPATVLAETEYARVQQLAGRLRAAGADAAAVCDTCDRAVPAAGGIDPAGCAENWWGDVGDCPANTVRDTRLDRLRPGAPREG